MVSRQAPLFPGTSNRDYRSLLIQFLAKVMVRIKCSCDYASTVLVHIIFTGSLCRRQEEHSFIATYSFLPSPHISKEHILLTASFFSGTWPFFLDLFTSFVLLQWRLNIFSVVEILTVATVATVTTVDKSALHQPPLLLLLPLLPLLIHRGVLRRRHRGLQLWWTSRMTLLMRKTFLHLYL